MKLEHGCYYVGWTTNIRNRLRQHWQGKGAKWTQLHKPLDLVLVREGNKDIENKVTKVMIERYGKERVRGGYFSICDSIYNLPLY